MVHSTLCELLSIEYRTIREVSITKFILSTLFHKLSVILHNICAHIMCVFHFTKRDYGAIMRIVVDKNVRCWN